MQILIAGIPGKTKNYENALKNLGISFQTSLNPENPANFDKLLLPGGGDLDPSLFGQTNQGSIDIDPYLDHAQLALLDIFVRLNRPVLGICRGMQVINVYFGGSIIQHLPTYKAHRWEKKDQVHFVSNLPGSVLYKLYGPCCKVNSAHHQGLLQIGKGFFITQQAFDGVIEAIEHKEKSILGVQWHPERTGFSFYHPGITDGRILIQYFLTQM